MNQSKLLKEYKNGNYKVKLFLDGNKIRFTEEDEFKPEFPESIDIKITNRCVLRCLMCHEKSTPTGKDGDLFHPFFDTLKEGTELAIGGGNPLEHKDLVLFLKIMKEKGIICNITVNQTHLVRYKTLIQSFIDGDLIKGIGISVNRDLFIDEIIEFCKINTNAIIHVIAGVIDFEVLKKLYDKDLNY